MQKSHILIPRWNHGTPVRCKLPLSVVTFPPLSLQGSKKRKNTRRTGITLFLQRGCNMVLWLYPLCLSVISVDGKREMTGKQLRVYGNWWGWCGDMPWPLLIMFPLYFVQYTRLPQFTHVNRTCSLTQGYFEKGENVYRGLMRICSP